MDDSRYSVSDAARAKALEAELAELYARRRGHFEPGMSWGWCAGCGRDPVSPDGGLDSCRTCLKATGG